MAHPMAPVLVFVAPSSLRGGLAPGPGAAPLLRPLPRLSRSLSRVAPRFAEKQLSVKVLRRSSLGGAPDPAQGGCRTKGQGRPDCGGPPCRPPPGQGGRRKKSVWRCLTTWVRTGNGSWVSWYSGHGEAPDGIGEDQLDNHYPPMREITTSVLIRNHYCGVNVQSTPENDRTTSAPFIDISS
jgi:hypothetical protein